MGEEKGFCMEHSEMIKAVENLEKKVEEFGDRLHELEKTVWKSSAITGLITGLVIFILEKLVG